MSPVRRLLPYFGPYKKDLALAAMLAAVETCFEMVIPSLMAVLVDEGLANGDWDSMLRSGAAMAFCALLSLVCGVSHARAQARASSGFAANLRQAQFDKIQEYGFENIDKFDSSSLVTRMTSDASVAQNALANGLRPLVRSPLMLCLGIFFAFRMNSRLALVFIVLAPVLAVLLFMIIRRARPHYARLQAAVDQLNLVLEENFRAARMVKAFVKEEDEEERFAKSNGYHREVLTKANSITMLNNPVFLAALYTAVVLIMWIGGSLIISGDLIIGEFTGFLSYCMQVLNSMVMLSNVFLLLSRSTASAKRILEVLDEEPSLKEPEDPVSNVADGEVEFRDVRFSYSDGGPLVLDGVSFRAPAGSTVGVVGPTGSGKSSLAQLMARLRDVSSGSVLVGGLDVREYSTKALRSAVVVSLQKNVLFTGTVRSNMRWGKPGATDDEIWDALRKAQADSFVESLDEGVSQGGVNFSGGQRQRLAVARVLLSGAGVLVFDDSTSALDTSTDAAIRRELKAVEGVTKFIIGQRISSVSDSDLILVLDHGRLAGKGTHSELLESCPVYRRMKETQDLEADNG